MIAAAVQGVVFDLDGTLYTLTAPKLRMTYALAGDLRLLRRLSASRKTLRGKHFANREELLTALADRLGHSAGLPASHALEWYEHRFYPAFTEMLSQNAQLRPGLGALLRRLRLRGVRIGVYSDYDAIPARLSAIGAAVEEFDDLISAEAYGVVKPAAAPLLSLTQKWGLAAQRVVMVGDRKDLDAQSAVLSGLQYIGLGNIPSRLFGSGSWHSVMKRLDLMTQDCETATAPST